MRKAVREARRVNDFLAAEIEKHPTRYAGFAHLPMQEPEAAAEELERCVRQLGFKGALINGHSNGVYLDDAQVPAVLGARSGARRSRSTCIPCTCRFALRFSKTIPGWRHRCGAGPRKPAAMRCVWS